MEIVFLLDNSEYVKVSPEKLQIRQIAPNQAALGIEVTVPVRKEDGTPETNEDGTEKTQVGFRPFINYAVNLTVPPPVEAAAPAVPAPAPVAEVVEAKSAKAGKAKAAKRRPN